jgi:hypothetical protein
MKIGKGNRSTWRKPTPAPLCALQIPLDQTRDRTRAAAVGSQQLTALAMVRPCVFSSYNVCYVEGDFISVLKTILLPRFIRFHFHTFWILKYGTLRKFNFNRIGEEAVILLRHNLKLSWLRFCLSIATNKLSLGIKPLNSIPESSSWKSNSPCACENLSHLC